MLKKTALFWKGGFPNGDVNFSHHQLIRTSLLLNSSVIAYPGFLTAFWCSDVFLLNLFWHHLNKTDWQKKQILYNPFSKKTHNNLSQRSKTLRDGLQAAQLRPRRSLPGSWSSSLLLFGSKAKITLLYSFVLDIKQSSMTIHHPSL